MPLSAKDARTIYLPVCLSKDEKAALKKTHALSAETLRRLIRNNANFGAKCK